MTLAERIRAASNALRSYADDGTLFVNRETTKAIVETVCEHFATIAASAEEAERMERSAERPSGTVAWELHAAVEALYAFAKGRPEADVGAINRICARIERAVAVHAATTLPAEGELPENVIRFDFLVRASKAARDLEGAS